MSTPDLQAPPGPRTPFRLGEFEVHPESSEIRGRRGVQRLRPLLMEVLLRLAAQSGQVVRRETLLEEVWPRRMVNDEVLSRAIAELRGELGDDARQARYIETLPKIGYRLVASPEPLADAAPPPPRRSPVPMAIGISVLVTILVAGGYALRIEPVPGTDLGARLANARPFTSDPGLEVGPRFSPDGQRIAYAAGEASQSRIVVQSLDGTQRRVIGEPGALRLSPVFFPGGRRIAYWQARGGDCAIVEHDLDAGTSRNLLDCQRSPRSRFDLSPDGRRIVFTGLVRAQFPAGLWLLDLETGASRVFTAPEPGFGDDLQPRFSPDGRRVAFFRGTESHRQLWIADVADPSTARQAARAEGLTYGAAWLGIDGPLVVAADWFGFRALNLVELPGGQARLLGARGARFPDATPGGDVVYENATYSSNLWLLDLKDGKESRRVQWPSTRYSNQAEFSPDGRQVVFTSNREGLGSLYVASLDGEPRLLVPSSEHIFMRPHWSADGRAIHAVRIAAGPARPSVQHAVRIDLAEGRMTVLEELGIAVNDVRESRDGRWLFVAELSGHAMRLLRTEAARPGRLERLPLPPMSEYHLNAERLVFAQPQLSGLTSCRLEGLTCEQLDIAIGDGNRFDWSLGERAIYFRLTGGETPQLARYDLAEGRLTWRSPFAPTGFGGSLAIAPGEAGILVGREERTTIDLMLVRR